MMNFIRNENVIQITNNKETLCINFINKNIINIYKQKENNNLLKFINCKKKINLCLDKDNTIFFENYKIVFYENLTFDIYDISNNCIIGSYKNDDTIIEENRDFSLAALEGHESSFHKHTYKTQISFNINDDSYIYGLGDKAGAFLNKKTYHYVQYNTDDPSAHNETYKSLYKSINFILLSQHNNYCGIFYPSSYKCDIDLGCYKKDLLYIASEKGEYDFYLFLGEVEEILKSYSKFVGFPILPSLKMLGNQQSRWSYANKKELYDVVENYAKYNIPLDYIHLDIDYMQKYKIFTIDENKFPDFNSIVNDLKQRGIGLVTIIDPGVKQEDGYFIYEELKNMNGFATLNNKLYVNQVWPGDSCFPNFFSKKVSTYFEKQTLDFINRGIEGIWCDMNEPASFKGPLPPDVKFGKYDHELIHNLYGDYMVRPVYNAFTAKNIRPYIITRAAYATTSHFSTTWNGDNQSLWNHLESSLPQIMSMNISNFVFNGVDIGGFGNECHKELLIRWIEAGVFSPLLRNHSSLFTRSQEPYAFDEETTKIYRKMLNIRYSFIPYLYNLFAFSHMNGGPVFMPLFVNYPYDEKVKQISDQVMIGKNIIHCPIIKQGCFERSVYLPAGNWISYFTNKVYKGQRSYLINENLDETQIFIKNNSIIPQYENLLHLKKSSINTLVLKLYGTHGKLVLLDDDGETLDFDKGIYNKYSLVFNKNHFSLTCKKINYHSSYKTIKLLYGKNLEKQKEISFDYNILVELD